MEFHEGPTYFTALLALILAFVIVKIVSFAFSDDPITDGETIISSVNEGAVAKQAVVDKGLRVRSTKSKKKRVKFVDDVVIRRVDLYEGSENLAAVEEKRVDENSGERVDDQNEENGLSRDLGGEIIKEQSFDDAQDKGSAEIEMLIEKECNGGNIQGFFSEKEKTLASSGPTSVVVEEEKNEEVFENDDLKTDQKDENLEVGCGENEDGEVRDESIDVEDEDWEGIERSELEKVFAEAVNYMEYGCKKDTQDDQLAKVLGNDVQLQLYGLHKVAVEGPCHEPQPMALKLSARAKWNAWQNLGSMSQDEAMEQYIKLLSDGIPGWMHNYSADDDIEGSLKVETIKKIPDPEYERKLELSATPIGDSSMGHGSIEKVTLLGQYVIAGARYYCHLFPTCFLRSNTDMGQGSMLEPG